MQQNIDLSGEWQFAIDLHARGESEGWFSDIRKLPQRCALPGSIQQQGFGDDITLDTPWTADRNNSECFLRDSKYAPYREPGNIKYPYWLQPAKYYAGPAWFAREVVIPDEWKSQRIELHLERAHWQTTVWVDGVRAGSGCDSLSTPHVHDLIDLLRPGRHTIVLRVDNRIIHKVGPNAHSVSDHTQGNWNGVVGRVELRASPATRLGKISTRTDWSARQLLVSVRVESDAPGRGVVSCRGVDHPIEWSSGGAGAEIAVSCDELPLWNEHTPNLIDTKVVLQDPVGREIDQRTIRHGLRQISTRGTEIFVNGVRTLLRGTLECCIFPKTGYPPTEIEPWRRIMARLKEFGLNHLRFHSWCPPEAAFVAADEAGVYFQIECATWPNQGATVGDGASLDQWVYEEAQRIIDAYGNHPSFVMLACGNEPAGERHIDFLEHWLKHRKERDPQRLHCGGAGWPENVASDFHIRFQPRIHHWGEGLASRINARDVDTTFDYREDIAAFDKPTVTHEIGQWCAFPDLPSIPKYNGAFRATSFEIVRDSLARNGLGHLATGFLVSSGKLQLLAYKEEIESQLRTPGLGGFQLLDLHDFPGQGTALVGVLDAFWDPKQYVTAEEFRRFCGPAVLLARIGKRTFTSDETFEAVIDLSYFGQNAQSNVRASWRVETESGDALANGELTIDRIEPGQLREIGRVAFRLKNVATPAALRLVVDAPGIAPQNDWSFWVYPPAVQSNTGVLITRELTDEFIAATASGRPVLLCPTSDAIASPVGLGFSPIFWNTLFTNGQVPHTLGLLIDADSPILKQFPTKSHSDWQWQEPIRHAACLMLDRLGAHRPSKPIVRVIDDWNENRSLGLLVEVCVGRSRVLISGIDLSGDLKDRLVSHQLRTAITSDLSHGGAEPEVTLSIEQLRKLLPGTSNADADADLAKLSTYGRL